MEESKTVNVNLDSKSIDILRKIDVIHRDSAINIGLALVEKTGYYKTLTGVASKETALDDVASLDVIGNESTQGSSTSTQSKVKKPVEDAPKKAAANWDAF